MAELEKSVNPYVVTHEVNIAGIGKAMVADHLREGYGDELSFGHLVQDTIGELTGSNKLAVAAGEDARETYDIRSDLIFADIARQQAENPLQPAVQIYDHANGQDSYMVVCWFDRESEKRVVAVAHCWDDSTSETGWDHKIVETRVL